MSSAYVIIDKEYQKKLKELYDELLLNQSLDFLEHSDDKIIFSSNPVIPGVFEYPSYINLSNKTILKMPDGTYIYNDPLDPNPNIKYPIYSYSYKSEEPTIYPSIVKTYNNKLILIPRYSYNSLNQKIKLASNYYNKLNTWLEEDFPNVLKYFKINKNDEVELIKSLDDKDDNNDPDVIKRKIKFIKASIIDEETICDIIDDFIDEKHIPLYRLYEFTYKFKEYLEEFLIDKIKRKISN